MSYPTISGTLSPGVSEARPVSVSLIQTNCTISGYVDGDCHRLFLIAFQVTLATIIASATFEISASHRIRDSWHNQRHGATQKGFTLFLQPEYECVSGVPRPLVESKSMLAKVSSLRLFEPNQKLIGVTAY